MPSPPNPCALGFAEFIVATAGLYQLIKSNGPAGALRYMPDVFKNMRSNKNSWESFGVPIHF